MKDKLKISPIWAYVLGLLLGGALIGVLYFAHISNEVEEKTNENVFCDYFNKLSIENIKNNQGFENIYEKNVAIKCIISGGLNS